MDVSSEIPQCNDGDSVITANNSGNLGKRPRLADNELNLNDNECDSNFYKRKLLLMSRTVCSKLDVMLSRMQHYQNLCDKIDEKVNIIAEMVRTSGNLPILNIQENSEEKKTIVVAVQKLPSIRESKGSSTSSNGPSMASIASPNPGQVGQVITLNCESDFPNGSWLGNPDIPELRVRCHISPEVLFHVHQKCLTPEKMALALLDYLFDRETLAKSNISGQGKHGKKQLNPLFIYGIQCHLIHKFNISEEVWHKIRLSLDSKCRTAFHRKQKELPFQKAKAAQCETVVDGQQTEESFEDLTYLIENAEVIQTEHGALRVLQATPEQIAKLHQTQHLKIINSPETIVTIEEEPVSEVVEEFKSD